MLSASRFLVVNADDFGMSRAVNLGILEAHARGIVTSASLMVHRPAAAAAVEMAASYPRLGLGLHLDLGEWAFEDGEWRVVYERVEGGDAAALRREVERQLSLFRRLCGRDPTHLDSHQNVHLEQPLLGIVTELAERLAVPLWHRTARVRHCNGFYGQTATGGPLPEAIGVDALVGLLATVGPGVTALRCHPGADAVPDLDPTPCYWAERAAEMRTLCDRRVRDAVTSRAINLCSFADPLLFH